MSDVSSGILSGLSMHGIDQVGVVVRDLDRAIAEMESLGVGPWYWMPSRLNEIEIHGKPEMIRLRIGMAMMGSVQLELLQPAEGPSVHQEFLDTRGEGLHHIGFLVEDFDRRVAAMAERGAKTIYARRNEGELVTVYMDALPATGLLCEFLKATPGMRRLFDKVKNLGKATT